ncbi:hypothetical protein NW762_000982 [Fusarium torreyae]|uniref:Vegetatible incompatibility protein het-e-1 n=1 Tax=Fusarium torreyae TaxID=1237075 RepID=A0A9W8VNK5_9HYPO|nr:hypothetical protein NW762_000982 [Fusarium torreyae]
MRRAALNKTKSRLRDGLPPAANTTAPSADSSVNVVEALRDEGFQTDHHQLVDPVTTVPSAPIPVSVAVSDVAHNAHNYSQPHLGHNDQLQYQPPISAAEQSHFVSGSAIDAPMTDAFPAEVDAVSATAAAIAATNTTSFAIVTASSTTSTTTDTSHQSIYDDQLTYNTDPHVYDSESETTNSDQDDIDLDLEASIRAPLLDDLRIPPTHLDLDPDYIPHYRDVDYDLEMSDSEGGAPLDDDAITEPQPQTDYQSIVLGEDNDGPAHAAGSVNQLSQSLLHAPAVASDGLIMDAAPPPVPWVTVPADGNAPLPQAEPPMPFMDPPEGPGPLSNPNPTMLGSENLGLFDFLGNWAYQAHMATFLSAPRVNAPCPRDLRRQANEQIHEIRYDDLRGDECDMQGLDWESMDTTRRYARQIRSATYKNYVNKEGSDRWSPHMVDVDIPPSESFMRFKRYLVRQDVYLAHFQLRSVLACPSISQVYYPGTKGVNRINPVSGKTELALNNSHVTGLGALISTLDANHGAMFAGTFNGEYYLKSLDSEDKKNYSDGQITQNMGGITNHVQIHMPRRSSGPVAAISSNDEGFRVLDLSTEKFVMQSRYRFPLNCSRISPDGRLRVMVGDDFKVLITDADTGEIQQELSGHRDYGFACDWSDDGWTVATGFQDKGVKIWDARRWCDSRGVSTPLCTIRSEIAGVRNLRFSPVGSGERVLVAAEEADYVNIINAQTFAKKQTVDIFGEIGGIAFTNAGQDLNVLVSDRHRGGLLQLERCSVGPEPYFRNSWRRYHDLETDQWRYRVDEYSHLGEPYQRKPVSTDALPIF